MMSKTTLTYHLDQQQHWPTN